MPFLSNAHPGIALVIDSKENIYYSDLFKVFRVTDNKKKVVINDVHTHELYLDNRDNLYGEDLQYGPGTKKFYHYLWRYTTAGKLIQVTEKKEAYRTVDFSLARDSNGNEYYLKLHITAPDHNHLYKRDTIGREFVIASGNFKGVSWLHPQNDGSILYTRDNDVFRITNKGEIKLVAKSIGNDVPTFAFAQNSMVYGLWQDAKQNVYAAVFSDKMVKKIDKGGKVTNYYVSKGNFAPTYGLFDEQNNLWLLESSDKNETRLTKVLPSQKNAYWKQDEAYNSFFFAFILCMFVIMGVVLFGQYLQTKFVAK